MYKTEWKDFEEYHECIISLRRKHSPILKVRAVKTAYGWEAVVRDYLTGLMVAYSNTKTLTFEKAKEEAILLSNSYLKECLSGEL